MKLNKIKITSTPGIRKLIIRKDNSVEITFKYENITGVLERNVALYDKNRHLVFFVGGLRKGELSAFTSTCFDYNRKPIYDLKEGDELFYKQ